MRSAAWMPPTSIGANPHTKPDRTAHPAVVVHRRKGKQAELWLISFLAAAALFKLDVKAAAAASRAAATAAVPVAAALYPILTASQHQPYQPWLYPRRLRRQLPAAAGQRRLRAPCRLRPLSGCLELLAVVPLGVFPLGGAPQDGRQLGILLPSQPRLHLLLCHSPLLRPRSLRKLSNSLKD